MTAEQEKKLNEFFVHIFNRILTWEEQALHRIGAKDLSVKEIHVLEAVFEQSQHGQNTMAAVAEVLSIQASSLTTSVNTLVRKGYLVREPDAHDRRRIYISLTPKGEEANRIHTLFHAQMIRSAAAQCSDTELDALTQVLAQLDRFFTGLVKPDEEN